MGIASSLYESNDDQSIALRQLRQYFAVRVNTFDELILVGQFIADEIGEQILDCFCLAEIDQWDCEHERYIFLCEATLIAIDFDFCRLEICNTRILPYALFDRIRIGQLCYENFSFETHAGKLGIKFAWNTARPQNRFSDWNPFSSRLAFGSEPSSSSQSWMLLTSHPLKSCIENALLCNLDDSYFSSAYLQTVHRRFAIEVFHDKLFHILQSLHARMPLNTPRLMSGFSSLGTNFNALSSSMAPDLLGSEFDNAHTSTLIQLERPSNPALPTFINYSPIVMTNVFNLPGYIYNRFRAGYSRLRYV